MAIGAFVVLSGLSGAVLVFRAELDRTLNPSLFDVAPRDGPQRFDPALRAVAERFPGQRLAFARLPRGATDSMEIWIGEPPYRRVYVDPYSGAILGWRGEHEGLTGTLHHLHVHLFAGEAGNTIMGVTGLALIAVLITGLALWWPRGRRWRHALRVRRGTGSTDAAYHLHRLTGVASFLLLFLSAVTGVSLVFHRVSASMLVGALGGPALPTRPKLADPASGPSLPVGALIERAGAALPGAVPSWITPPASPLDPFVVRLRYPENPHPNGSSYVALDPRNGQILMAHDHRDGGAGQKTADFRYPLHIGAFWGSTGRILTAATGVAPAILLATGVLFWLRRRRGSARNRPAIPTGRRGQAGVKPS